MSAYANNYSNNSKWQVPKVVKTIFDTFPLYQHPADDLTEYQDRTNYSGRRFELVCHKPSVKDDSNNHTISSTSGSKKSNFQIGVYNISPYLKNSKYLLPTDPVCLSCQLIINLRNGLSFPSSGDFVEKDSALMSKNYISLVSYQTAPDNQLPIFIEHESVGKRKITMSTTTLINDLQLSRTKPRENMKCLAVDSVLYDYWVITLLFEVPQERQQQIYCLNPEDTTLNKLTLYKIITSSVLTRFGFENRNPKITKYYTQALYNNFLASIPLEVQAEIDIIKTKSRQVLSPLQSSLQAQEFLTKGKNHPGVLDCKVTGYIYHVIKYAPTSSFSNQLTEDYQELISHAYKVIDASIL